MSAAFYDVVIVGAGPAGLSAALRLASQDLRVVVIDEFPEAGGRMLGQFHEEPGKGYWIGKQVADGLIEQCQQTGVEFRLGAAVHGLKQFEGGWCVLTTSGWYTCRSLLLATGAAEVPQPLPGWTMPGVMSIGAAQVMANVHRVKPGNRGIIIGANVLSMAIAQELSLAGVEISAIVLPPMNVLNEEAGHPVEVIRSLRRLGHLAPSPILRFGARLSSDSTSRMAARLMPKRGFSVWGIPLKLRTCALQVNGLDTVESVTLANVTVDGEPIRGTERDMPVDFVAIAGGLYPLAELAAVAGCPFVYMPELGGHVPLHSPALQSTLQGLYFAGNITGVESAQVAMAQGELAAASIWNDFAQSESSEATVQAAMGNVENVRRRAIIQFHPEIAQARARLSRLWEDRLQSLGNLDDAMQADGVCKGL